VSEVQVATLAEVAQALHTLGPQAAEKIQVLMISVDPDRDTPDRMATYVTHFHPSYLGLTGTPEEPTRSTLIGENQSGASSWASGGMRPAWTMAIAFARFTRP
jgi:hypothetical protein